MELEQRVEQLEKDHKNLSERVGKVEEGQSELKRYLDRIDVKLDNNQSQLMAILGQALGIRQASVASQTEITKTKWTTMGAIVTAALAGGGGLTLVALSLLDKL